MLPDLHKTTTKAGSSSRGDDNIVSPRGDLPKHTRPAKGADIALTQLRQVTKPDLVTLPCARNTSSHSDPFSGPGHPFQGPHGLYPIRIRFRYISPLHGKTADCSCLFNLGSHLEFRFQISLTLGLCFTLLLLSERTRLFSLI